MASSMLRSSGNQPSIHFWQQVKKTTNSKVPLPDTLEGVSGSKNIADFWSTHYKSIFNSVKPDLYLPEPDDIYYDPSVLVNCHEMCNIIDKLSGGKAAGPDGLCSEHFKYCGPRINYLLAMLFTSVFIHGYIPSEINKSVLVPIIKSKSGILSDKNNYRPIGISPVCSKILECVILQRIEKYIKTTDNQFGFKYKHSTESCIFLLKEILHYFKNHGTPSFVCFMDASKAFDRLNHGKLLNLLATKNVPVYIIRVIAAYLTNQQLCVRWNGIYSELFSACNGVRQGGILSPYLFNIYINEISLVLNKQDIGCTFQNCQINHLLYADDLVLISPSSKGLQKLISCCTHVGNNLNIIFNDSKTVCMTFCKTSITKCKAPFPDMYMNEQKLKKMLMYLSILDTTSLLTCLMIKIY